MKKRNTLANENLIEESEHKLHETMHNLEVGFYSVAANGLLLDHNKSYNRIFGIDPDKDLKGAKLSYFLWNSDERKEYLDKLITNGFIRNYLINAKKNNGEKIFVIANSHVVNNEQGKLVKIDSTIMDFTIQIQAEEALRKSEEKHRNIFENIQDVYFETSIDGTILELSPAIKTVMKGQYQRNDFIGKSILTLYFEPEARKSLISLLCEKGAVTDYEIALKNRDGLAIAGSISAKLCFDTNDHPVRIIGSIRDISKRKLAEEELNKNRVQLLNAHLIAHLGGWEYDIVNDLFIFNDPFYAIFHTTAEQVGGYKMRSDEYAKRFIHPDDISQVNSEILNAIESNDPDYNRQLEHRFLYSDGGIGYLSVRFFIIKDKNGKTVKTYGVNQDITERKMIEIELRKARNKAEESDRLKTAFLHNISHEIRTPMNAIWGFSALLGENDTDSQTRKSYIEVIMQSSNHLLEIINDIIDISNIEANQVKIVKTEINVNSKLKLVYELFLHKASEKNIQLLFETIIPDPDAFITTDCTKFIQILNNLVNNAIKFTDEGSVKVSCVLKDQFLEFCVSDTGIGIPAEFHSRIFETFFQLQFTESRMYEGTGLGLAISKAYLELLGGRIWVISEPGNGTSFYFTIPYVKKVFIDTIIKEKNVSEEFAFPVKKSVLVAEDDDNNFKLIKYFLSQTNFNVLRANNGKEAVDTFLSDKRLDLILMDIKMPVMDGLTAVKLIREKNTSIPIIALSAYIDEREKAIQSGCSCFISKPFNKRELLKVITKYI